MTPSAMTSEQLRAWRKRRGWKPEEAANVIGIGVSSLFLYEAGKRYDNEKSVLIPLPIAWACAAIEAGLQPLGEEKNGAVNVHS